MTEKFLIKKVRDGAFQSNGETVEYYWVKAERISDGVTLEFGSKKGDFEVDQEVDLELEKTERVNAKTGKTSIGYKHVPEE